MASPKLVFRYYVPGGLACCCLCISCFNGVSIECGERCPFYSDSHNFEELANNSRALGATLSGKISEDNGVPLIIFY